MNSTDGSATDRWRTLVRDRLAEMERLSPARGAVGPGFWDARAPRFAARMTIDDAARDPFFRRLAKTRGTALDVGAGTGRFTVNLALRGRNVTAVDPSAGMLKVLNREARERGVGDRISTVLGRWEEVDVEPAEVAFSSYVVSMVEEAPPFLEKLSRSARAEAFLYLGAYSMDAVMDPLWRHFHNASRQPGPTYLDAVAVLRELGVRPAVEVVEVANRRRFETVSDATAEYADYLLLPARRAVRRELEVLLRDWLVPRRGLLAPPLRYVPAAIIRWPGRATCVSASSAPRSTSR